MKRYLSHGTSVAFVAFLTLGWIGNAWSQDFDLELDGLDDMVDQLEAQEREKERKLKAAEKAEREQRERERRRARKEEQRNREIAAELTRRVLEDRDNPCEQVVFMTGQRGSGIHYYENVGGYYCNSSGYRSKAGGGGGGAIKRLDLRSGKVTVIFEDPRALMRDLRVHYSGERLIFSYRKPGTVYSHLYEVNTDGSGLRQLTDGPWDDYEPCYLPNGDIVFSSSRCKRWVPCWNTQVASLYRCSGDGSNIRPLSSSPEMENTPFVLPDGRVLYTRWEYTDRSMMVFHHLWTFNPDGTGLMVYYGNEHPGGCFIDGMPIPGTRKVLFNNSPGHGRRFRTGMPTVLDPMGGPGDQRMARQVLPYNKRGREPCPVTDEIFLFVKGSIVLMDRDGRYGPIYSPTGRDEGDVWDPRPLRPRAREAIIPDRVDLEHSEGILILADAYHGRKMQGVKRGDIKKLLILEEVPKPVAFGGSREQISLHGSYMLHRIIGTVPVEADGSAHFRVPAMRSLFFVTLDENNMSVKRMQSFTTVMPGETTSCVGCHEQRYENPRPTPGPVLEALRRPPSEPEYPEGIPDVICFARDVQPVLDRHCLRCHSVEGKREGHVTLDGDRGSLFSNSFFTLWAYGQLSDGRTGLGNEAPRAIGTSASPLMQKIDGSHHGVKLSKKDHDLIRLWIESSCVYAGTYAALGTRPINIGSAKPLQADTNDTSFVTEDGEIDEAALAAAQDGAVDLAPSAALKGILGRRCSGCHALNGNRPYKVLDGSARHETGWGTAK